MQNERVVTKSFLVTDLQLLGENIYRVRLCCEEGELPDYNAGQYLEILLASGDCCAFSIASAPVVGQTDLELHIQKLPDRESSSKIFSVLEGGRISARLPKGRCHAGYLSDKPLLLIAAGTGFAQMKGIIEHCFNIKHPHDIHFYWGARTPGDFYLPNLPVQWAGGGLHYHPVVSDTKMDNDWCGRYGLLYEAVLADKSRLLGTDVYISGSPNMVYATVDAMLEEGFSLANMHSDVFEYAPRE